MSIAINSNFERDQYQATSGQTEFAYSFPIFNESYLAVYKRAAAATPNDATDLLTLGDDYSVAGVGTETGGAITLVVAATAGDVVTLVGIEPIDRESVFQDYNPFTVALNQQLNEQTVMAQQSYTYWNHVTPRYYFSTLVSDEVRPLKRILPMLPDGHVWIGRGEINDDIDDITTQSLSTSGIGNVIAAHENMVPSITLWTGEDYVVTDSNITIDGNLFAPTSGHEGEVTGFTDEWGGVHIPGRPTAGRPVNPTEGDIYYDTDENDIYIYSGGTWNVIGSGGSGGGATLSRVITQVGHTFSAGDYVRLDGSPSSYVLAQADTAEDSESVGLVIGVDGDDFTLATYGYIAAGVFTGLTPSAVYFLSATNPGVHTTDETTVEGEVSFPVFVAETATTGYLKPSRPIIVGGQPPIGGGGGGGGSDSNVNIVTQTAHGFAVLDMVLFDGVDYIKGQADDATNAETLGMVTEVPSVNEFYVQVGGYVDNLAGAALTAGETYFLSDVTAGLITLTPPTTPGSVRKACFIATDTDAGYIMPYLGEILGSTDPAAPTAGSVVQMVPYVFNTRVSYPASSGWVTIASATIAITPTYSTSKILIDVRLDGFTSADVFLRILRLPSTSISVGVAATHVAGTNMAAAGGSTASSQTTTAFCGVDTPSVVTPVTYVVQYNGGIFYLNGSPSNSSGSSTIIVTEIAV